MRMHEFVVRNIKNNMKNYYLYVFALIFSVGLYFSFVTLQYDPAMDQAKGSVKGAAAIRTASILLVAIVTVFLVYANYIFTKRRSKEIGLLQLVGFTKGRIIRLLSVENLILYFGALTIGIFVGFSFSKLMMMILFNITDVELVASLSFRTEAFRQTIVVFSSIYFIIVFLNYLFIKKQSILSLFKVVSRPEQRVKKHSMLEIVIGILGFVFITTGYVLSAQLFGGSFTSVMELFLVMFFILFFTILGTYFFYKGTVSYIANLMRKRKNGYLPVREVVSLTSVMFRMKSNALLLTVITTVSALSIGLLSLSYIAYYSTGKIAEDQIPEDFTFIDEESATTFKRSLEENGIKSSLKTIDVLQVTANFEPIIQTNNLDGLMKDITKLPLSVISEEDFPGIDLKEDETVLTGYSDILQKFLALKDSGSFTIRSKNQSYSLRYLERQDQFVVSWYFTGGGAPVAIVDHALFTQLKNDLDPEIQKGSSTHIGIDVLNRKHSAVANQIFEQMGLGKEPGQASQLMMQINQKKTVGLAMFIVAFLGLTFLITSGCILYFKQMDEAEDERHQYTILRKIGFTQGDLLQGIRLKQLYNFGIPLIIGLTHSYFAVQSGWFLFGSELWKPMSMVMILYTILYSLFGLLSVGYYRRVIETAL